MDACRGRLLATGRLSVPPVRAWDVRRAPAAFRSVATGGHLGKAVIAPRVGGIPEFVRDGETGLLVRPGDAGALAEAMLRLDSDDSLRSSLAAHGHTSATTEHAWARVVDAYRALYDDVLRRPITITPRLASR